jgi:mannose/fructose/N-acetylgalactosamine-specific phosphotransferase system component IIC
MDVLKRAVDIALAVVFWVVVLGFTLATLVGLVVTLAIAAIGSAFAVGMLTIEEWLMEEPKVATASKTAAAVRRATAG